MIPSMIRGFYTVKPLPFDVDKESARLQVGYYSVESSASTGEFGIVWDAQGSMTITVHDDALNILSECSDVFKELKRFDKQVVKPEDVMSILTKLGFKDFTK